jgi:alpha-L-rhamnosidase
LLRLGLLLVVAIITACTTNATSATSSLTSAGLRCEYQTNPLAVDGACPRLSWRIESQSRAEVQSAYRVIVASTRELLVRDQGDLRDSGKIFTNKTIGIEYQGAPLKSSQRVWWKVRVWAGEDRSGKNDASEAGVKKHFNHETYARHESEEERIQSVTRP